MNESRFFELYLPALEKAMEYDRETDGYEGRGPDWFIEDADLSKEMDLFESENVDKYLIFDKVAWYFDARAHGFDEIRGVDIYTCRDNILKEISWVKFKYLC